MPLRRILQNCPEIFLSSYGGDPHLLEQSSSFSGEDLVNTGFCTLGNISTVDYLRADRDGKMEDTVHGTVRQQNSGSPKQIRLHFSALDHLERKIFLIIWNFKIVVKKDLAWKVILSSCNVPAKELEQNELVIHYGPN